jgi:hypothetical protein
MKKSKRDLEMKHKNCSSQTHSNISLQIKDLKWERQETCEREWKVFFKLEMEFGSCSYVGGEVGVSIYRWASKLAVWLILAVEDRLNRP